MNFAQLINRNFTTLGYSWCSPNVKDVIGIEDTKLIFSKYYIFKCWKCFLGLFERHKLLFSFQMTIKIMEADSKLNPEELDFFLKGNISLEKSSRSKPFAWIPEQGWEDIQRLMTVTPEAFSSLSDDIERNGNEWKEVQR